MTILQHPARPPLWTPQLPLSEDGSCLLRCILIANRGEIACRVIRTCRQLGVTSIAVYADEDSDSRHVLEADHAISLGSVDQPGGNPFLNIPKLIQVALDSSADAIHPGYGYLSENVQFADGVRDAGLIFVGPASAAMLTLGDKRQAKEYLAKHEKSIPLIPGWTGGKDETMDLDELERQAERIGYPIMLKASAGGGGKGMRVVRDASTLRADLERAQSEAQRSFGSSECILEKYIEAGKHVEVQIIGDRHENVISFWERDCSVQRRHQKVIEETPCSWLSQEKREEICAAAVRVGKLLNYENAGTVEFIVDTQTSKFYFLEVNARLQVEHPITEECTGVDLVSLQLFVAVGGNLGRLDHLQKIPQLGHAIECRLCAEDPLRDFAPQHGPIRLWRESSPASTRDARFETAISSGARVSIYFDSMIAKIVIWAPTRSMAIDKMIKTLAETVCIGPTTNQLFLQACLSHKGFAQSPEYTASFIPNNLEVLLQNPHISKLSPSLHSFSAMPSLFLRELRRQALLQNGDQRQMFGSVRRSFRNQRFDRTNVPCDIITKSNTVGSLEEEAIICFWDFQTQSSGSSGSHTVQIAPLPMYEPQSQEQLGPEKDGDEIPPHAPTMSYNKLSALIRKGELPNATFFKTKIISMDVQSNQSWTTGRLDVSINGQLFTAYVASDTNNDEADIGFSTKVIVHLPHLGAPMEYRSYSVLAFYESLRQAMTSGNAASSSAINAPMPCKVLRVIKKNGDEVQIGEIVMVVESMKMEITIAAGKKGIFQSSAEEGEAVEEGSLLCTLE